MVESVEEFVSANEASGKRSVVDVWEVACNTLEVGGVDLDSGG